MKRIRFQRNGDDWKQVVRDAFVEGRDDDALKIIQRETEMVTIFWNEEFFGKAYSGGSIIADIPGLDARRLGAAGRRVSYSAGGIYDGMDGFEGPHEAFSAVGYALQFHATDGIGYVSVAVSSDEDDHPWGDRLIFAAYSRARSYGDDNPLFREELDRIKRAVAAEKALW